MNCVEQIYISIWLNSEITIKDLIFPKDVEVMREDNEVVAVISRIQEEKEEENTTEEEAVGDVAVETGKKEEEE